MLKTQMDMVLQDLTATYSNEVPLPILVAYHREHC